MLMRGYLHVQAANANDKLVSIPESNAQLQRLGFTSADVLRPLRWQEIFDEGLILTREHCEIAYSEHNRRDITVKAPAKLFPEAAHMCADYSCLAILLSLQLIL
jgi:hypothetical protein